ncbi:MAG: hypothetical protein GXO79_06310 [Chlorobi bacterium]|nr:hypothetical protein [Chlorobiota bacterium]
MKEFKIYKQTGTYAETLEAYGLANLLFQLLDKAEARRKSITILSNEKFYTVTAKTDITDEIIEKLNYFHIIKFIARKRNDLPEGIDYSNVFQYEEQKTLREQRRDEINEVYKKFSGKEKEKLRKIKLKRIEEKYNNESATKIDIEFDVYSQASTPNQLSGFKKIFNNFYLNKDNFKYLIKDILSNYSGSINLEYPKLLKEKKLKNFSKEITATQLYNPNQGKGLNKTKANGLNGFNFHSSWISETLKTAGAINSMICQPVKVGSSYDLKVFVPEFNNTHNLKKTEIINSFKNNLKGNTPIKIDILNILILIKKLIEKSEEYQEYFGNAKNIIEGLHSVYQKDLGQNKAISNIAFIQTPDFIEINNQDDVIEWLEILEEQISIISNIEELGSSVQALMAYRNFINSSNLESFFKFSNWYSVYLMQSLTNEKYYVKPFTYETLTKFYYHMDTTENLNLKEIISNEGFQAVAKAIKNSTVSLQFQSKNERKFNIRYGVAQNLQNKSKSISDLVEYIGEFITRYNSETAHYRENNSEFKDRAIVKADELTEFYLLLDKYSKSSKVIGALLGSYGFAINKKDKPKEKNSNSEEITE